MNKDRIMAYIDNQSEIKKCVETQFPFFIAHEYHRFYELLEKGQLFGAFFEMKDVMEVLLKFPILVGTAYIESKREPLVRDMLRSTAKYLPEGWKKYL